MHTFFYLGIAMVAGLVLSRVVKKLRLPNVTGYLIAGLLIGPCVLGLVPQAALDKLNIITTIARGIAFHYTRVCGTGAFRTVLGGELLCR